jgi:glycosyltransferase involved in cell wall biosynthesis
MTSVNPPDARPTPTVDIVVPCYNYARYLEACVQSVLTQPGVSVKVLVIDDHSTDDTPAVGARLAQGDPRVHYRRHERNVGHIATYNEGLSEATAEYVVLLSADDMLTPGALQRATALMEANPAVGLVYGCPIALYGEPIPPARTRLRGWKVWKGREWIALMCHTGRNFINSPEVVMRTEVQHAIGGYRSSLPHSGDMEMWLRAARISDVGWLGGVDQAYYRVHPLSMQRTTHAGVLRDLQGRLDAYESALDEADTTLNARVLIAQSRRALAAIALRHATTVSHGRDAAGSSVDDYLDFARQVFPPVVDTLRWRLAERTREPRRGITDHTMRKCSLGLEWMRRHVEWRRWSRSGVY